MESTTSTNTPAVKVDPAHVAQALDKVITFAEDRGLDTQIHDGDYDLSLVANDWSTNEVRVTAWTLDENGDNVEVGNFRITIEQVI